MPIKTIRVPHWADHRNLDPAIMESIVVEAIRQIPALVLAGSAFYFYWLAKKAASAPQPASALPEGIADELRSAVQSTSKLEQQLSDLSSRIEDIETEKQYLEEAEESIRSQLSNQKMALKEFGRVLSKTSEQTYTDFNSFEERLTRIEESLNERGMLNGESRSAAA